MVLGFMIHSYSSGQYIKTLITLCKIALEHLFMLQCTPNYIFFLQNVAVVLEILNLEHIK